MKRNITQVIGDINLYLEECDNKTIAEVYNILSTKKLNTIKGNAFEFELSR